MMFDNRTSLTTPKELFSQWNTGKYAIKLIVTLTYFFFLESIFQKY